MIRATTTRYVIKLAEQETTTASGIIVKGSGETQLGVIVDIGPKVENPIPLGTRIVVDWNQILPIKYRNEQLFILDQISVLGVVNDQDS